MNLPQRTLRSQRQFNSKTRYSLCSLGALWWKMTFYEFIKFYIFNLPRKWYFFNYFGNSLNWKLTWIFFLMDRFWSQNISSHIFIIGYGGEVTIRSTLSESIESILFELPNIILLYVSIALFIGIHFLSFNNAFISLLDLFL